MQLRAARRVDTFVKDALPLPATLLAEAFRGLRVAHADLRHGGKEVPNVQFGNTVYLKLQDIGDSERGSHVRTSARRRGAPRGDRRGAGQ